jgi:hypothetical protein
MSVTKPKNIWQQFDDRMKVRADRLILFSKPAYDEGGLEIDTCTAQWLDALDAFEGGDKSRLVILMKSGYPLPKHMLPHIGDMIDRWKIVRPAHKMSMPSHQWTDDDVAMYAADCDLNDLLKAGKPFEVALKEIIAKHGVKESKMRAYHAKRIGPERRAKARVYDAKRRVRRRSAGK